MNLDALPKLRILHIISGDLWAGAEAMAFNLLIRLKAYDDLDISAILLNDARLAETLANNGISTFVIDEHRTSFSAIAGKIRDVVKHDPPNLIHSHRYKENSLALLASLSRKGIKLVSTQHGLPEFHDGNASTRARIISKLNFMMLVRFFTTVAVSDDIRKTLLSCFGFRTENLEIIHNGIILPNEIPPASKSGSFVVGSSGRLFPVKNYALMVDIANAVIAQTPGNISFELAGDGPEKEGLEARTAQNCIKDHFHFKGHVDDMNSFYRGLDVYLNTSIHEGIPMTILEAMGHGLPIVAPAVGGIVEIIENGKEGFLIGSRNPGDFAEKCLLLKNDRELWERMSLAAREKAEKCFSAEIMAEKYNRLYKRLIG